jgi:predicted permease
MGGFLSDLRHSLRVLWKSPGFTIVAVLALALGIGANTAIFSVLNQVLLRPLPFADSERIMRVQRQYPSGTGNSTSIPKFVAWRKCQAFQSMAAYDFGGLSLSLGASDRPDPLTSLHVSAGFFDVFGVSPIVGRTFTAEEDLPGAGKFVVVTFDVWKNRFASDRNLVGKPILLNSEPYVVVGVLPPGYQPDPPADLYVPLQADPNSTNQGHYLLVAGRLRPGATIDGARAALKIIGEQFRATYPMTMDKTETVGVIPLREAIAGEVKPALLILAGAVSFVLLMACANVANLLLARAAGRQKEVAIRTAIGASRGRIVRQLLTESLLLALAGGAGGFFLGAAGVRALLAASPGNIPRINDPSHAASTLSMLDWRVLVFLFGVSLFTGVLFGLFPALQVSRLDVNSYLKESSGRSSTGLKQNRIRGLLVVAEIALALVLLIGATLMIRTFAGLRAVNPGFDASNVLTLKTSLASGRYVSTAQVEILVRQVSERIEALPGIQSAASAIILPLEGGIDLPFSIEGRTPAGGGKWEGDEQWRSVSAHYFQVLRIPLLRGRVFDERDTGKSPRVVVINEAFARKHWPKGDPIGQRITIGKGLGPEFEEPPREIVGIVGSVHEVGLSQGAQPVMYVPAGQTTDGLTRLANNVLPLSWMVRARTDVLTLSPAIEREFLAVDRQLAPSRIRTMERVMAESTARTNFNTLLLAVFASAALLLAAIGIYGLISYSVEQRTQEIGVRVALGAGREQVLKMILLQGMRLAAIGIVLGLVSAFGLSRVLSSLLFGVKAADPLTFAMVAGTLAVVALLATFVPARRATRIDPLMALRHE